MLRRIVSVALTLATLGVPTARSAAASAPCTRRLLVLSATPGEMDRLITEASVRARDTVVIDGRSFYVGRLRGHNVVLALTGIGLVNAERTTRAALGRFRCISGIVFSGVAGGSFIGDVVVPARWTGDDGKSWLRVDPQMFATARTLDGVQLAQDAPAGDAACVGQDPRSVRAVHLDHVPKVLIGGAGKSADPFGGRAFTCIPCGGDVFGCEPCRAPGRPKGDAARSVAKAATFADPNFFLDYFRSPPPPTTADAQDMETAAVARVAHRNRTPFIAFRAVSDGQGDPLHLPGFPVQFFVYRQLAADNAAKVALAFLEAWRT